MDKVFIESVGVWMFSAAEGCVLHRKGGEDFPPLRQATVVDPEEWEEVAEGDVPRYSEAEYSRKVAELVHERYSVDDEIALINNVRDTDPSEKRLGEYAEYQAYRAECKVRAKALLAGDSSLTEEQERTEGQKETEEHKGN